MRLLICDDSAPAREALRAMLDGQGEIEIVGETATRSIREVVPATRVVAFAGSDDVETVMAMMDAGASAYCVKGAPLWELERAIVGAHDPLLRLAHVLNQAMPGGIGHLVAREAA